MVMRIGPKSSAQSRRPEELLALGRGAELPFPAVDPIARLKRVAERRAAHPALVAGDDVVSYAELVKRVGQLAGRLRELNVGPEARVGVCVPRGADEAISLLAVWAAGGAYVPLDPSHPAERIRIILEDARPEVLITHGSVAGALDVPESVRVLRLDEERSALAQRVPPRLNAARDPEQLAYLLFTSGSTGRPKGVAVPRRAIANFLRSMAHTPGMSESDRLLSVTTITFDIAGLELFLPLWVGATVEIADRETVLDPALLCARLERGDVTIMQATPTTWRLLLEAGFGATGTALRMLCGGEAMSRELAQRLTATGGELWNMYGPTETTVWSTLCRVPRAAHTITIGRPIDETQLYVLDESLELTPKGEIGELWIGGQGVARGYFDRDELTAARFRPNPHGPAGDLIYRTGDLARWLPNGELECLGRIDHQVKIRGFRIELGEIESCLREVEGLREVVVVARAQPDAEARLVAYFVGDAAVDALRARAASALPSYMHPSAYVRLETMPLNTNGKIDRNQLPEPPAEAEVVAEPSDTDHPPSDTEIALAALVEEVLGVKNPPLDRDLFALGATSVKMVALRRRIQEEFDVELPLATMFETPSIAHLAAALSQAGDQLRAAFVPLVRGQEDKPPLLCLMGVALYRDLARRLGDGRTVYGVHVPYRPAEHEAEPRIEELARLYVEAILAHVPRGPYHLAGLCFGGLVAFEVARQLIMRGREVHSVALFDAALPRAEHYSLSVRGRELMRDLTWRPERTWSKLKELAARKLHLRSAAPTPAPTPEEARAQDPELDVDGPLAQQMVRDYQRRVGRVDVPLLVVRARERNEPAWRRVDTHMGWLGLSPQLSIAPVPGSHLEILREPNVATTAESVRLTLSMPLLRGERETEPSTRDSCAPSLPLGIMTFSGSRSRTGEGGRAPRR
jgi:amino acid adenylation domain-containing protein